MNTGKHRPILQIRNRTLLLADLVLIVTAVLASFALRLDVGPLFNYYLPSVWTMVAIAIIVKPLVYYIFGLYRRYWVYASVRELRLIFVATLAASACVGVLGAFFRALGGSCGFHSRPWRLCPWFPTFGDWHRLAALTLQRWRPQDRCQIFS